MVTGISHDYSNFLMCRHSQRLLLIVLITLIFLQVIRMEKITREIGSASQANVRLTSLKKTLATKISPRVLLPAINKTYTQIKKNWKVRLYWVLNFGQGRGGTEICKFLLKNMVL